MLIFSLFFFFYNEGDNSTATRVKSKGSNGVSTGFKDSDKLMLILTPRY